MKKLIRSLEERRVSDDISVEGSNVIVSGQGILKCKNQYSAMHGADLLRRGRNEDDAAKEVGGKWFPDKTGKAEERAVIRIVRKEDDLWVAELVKPKGAGLGVKDQQRDSSGWGALEKMVKNFQRSGFME